MSIILPAPPPDGSVGVERTKEGTWRAAMAVTLHKDARVLNQGQRVELKDAPPRVKAHITRYVGCAALLQLEGALYEDLFDVLGAIDEISALKLHVQVQEFLFSERKEREAAGIPAPPPPPASDRS